MTASRGFSYKVSSDTLRKTKIFGSIKVLEYLCLMNKFCKYCGIEKPTSEFHRNSVKEDGLADRCKECRRVYHRQHYLNNKKVYIDKAKIRSKELSTWFENYKKELKCEFCGETRWWVLDFHHRDSKEKDGSISNLVRSGSKMKLTEEIKKCNVLCSNCHRDLHYKERQAVFV